jgi:hypothetical protein
VTRRRRAHAGVDLADHVCLETTVSGGDAGGPPIVFYQQFGQAVCDSTDTKGG